MSSLEARLQRVEDELAIRRLIIEYPTRLDARDYDGYAALFARKGQWINGKLVKTGPEEIKAMLVGIYGPQDPDFVNMASFHITSNPQVEVDGDRASAHSRYLLIKRGPNGEPVPTLTGCYDDDYIREDGEWKILRRVDNPIMPTREEWAEHMRTRAPIK